MPAPFAPERGSVPEFWEEGVWVVVVVGASILERDGGWWIIWWRYNGRSLLFWNRK